MLPLTFCLNQGHQGSCLLGYDWPFPCRKQMTADPLKYDAYVNASMHHHALPGERPPGMLLPIHC